jgi:hypothetical protein
VGQLLHAHLLIDAKKVAAEGVFLNRLLLQKGLATLFT